MLLALFAHAEFAADRPGSTTLEAPTPDWTWVGGAGSTVTLMDMRNDRYLAQFNNGVSTLKLAIPASKNEFYSIETYMARMYRGARTDVVTIRAKDTLKALAEIQIPAKSYEGMSLLHAAGLTDDDRFLVSFNMTPGQSVSVVDMQDRTFVGELDTTGCALVYPAIGRRFHMLCGDGGLATLQLDAAGQELARSRTSSFFDPQADPLLEKGARLGGAWYFSSFNALLYKIDVVDGETQVEAPWSLVSERQRKKQWRPGGMVPLVTDPENNRLLVLMHRGGTDTHKQGGTQAWVFDLASRARQSVIRLRQTTQSLHLTRGEAPLLLALNDDGDQIDVYHAHNGRYSHTVEAFGDLYPALFHSYLR